MSKRITRRTILTLGAAAAAGIPARSAQGARRVQPAAMQATAATPARNNGRIDMLSNLLQGSGVPGMSVAAIENGTLAWTHALGMADAASGEPLAERSVFQAASLTKPLLAYVTLALCEQGKMSLDTPLRDYIHADELSQGARANQITPRLILSHSSGLPAFRPARGRLTPRGIPGTAFSYSGAGYELLQDAVEQVTGEALETYAARTVFAPLGMHESSLVWHPEYAAAAAVGHDWDGSVVCDVSRPERANAAGSLHTTPSDFARLLMEMISSERNGAFGLDYVYKCMARSPQIRLADGLAWGLGWGLALNPAGDSFWHFGDSRGYMCHAIAFPATRSGVVVFTNGRRGLRLAEKAADSLLGHPEARAAQAKVFRWIYDVFYEGQLRP